MASVDYDEYVKNVDVSSRKVLDDIREFTLELVPEAELVISYGIPTFKFNGKNLIHFGAFKEHLSFFPGPFVIETFKERLSLYKISKGTIQVPYSESIDFDLLKDMISFRVKELKGFVVVGALLKKPVKEVWYDWTDVDEVVNWNFASDDWACPNAMNDLRPEGSFIYRMEAKDGSVAFDFSGYYKEIREEEFISYTLNDGRLVEIDFRSVPSGTWIMEAFMPEGENSVDRQREGWQSILNNFKKYVESK